MSGKTLALNAANGGVTNTGTLEATGGGVLTLNNTITNAGGNITASGAGSTVNVVGTITSGTLNTDTGGLMQSVGGGSDLNAVTISGGSTYTAESGTTNTAGRRPSSTRGRSVIDGSTGDAIVNLGSDVMLSGGGTVTFTHRRRLPARRHSHPDQYRQHHPGRGPNWGQRRADRD